mmetsp:Transcript_43866/g.102383  ORF Transcript_43866/g.102383 Transcript_43866/m.102383 type:complete len:200 (-) Transcript_43866:549-1148(-)
MKNQRSRHLDAKSPTTASSNTCEPLRSNALATFCSARWPNFTLSSMVSALSPAIRSFSGTSFSFSRNAFSCSRWIFSSNSCLRFASRASSRLRASCARFRDSSASLSAAISAYAAWARLRYLAASVFRAASIRSDNSFECRCVCMPFRPTALICSDQRMRKSMLRSSSASLSSLASASCRRAATARRTPSACVLSMLRP